MLCERTGAETAVQGRFLRAKQCLMGPHYVKIFGFLYVV